MCHHLYQDLNSQNADLYPEPIIKGMLEFEWDLFIDEKKKVSISIKFSFFNFQSQDMSYDCNMIYKYTVHRWAKNLMY